MKKRSTRRKRKEARRRSASKHAALKAANLLAYEERRAHEKEAWARYWDRVRDACEDYCPGCPLSLLCMTHKPIRDLTVCVICSSVYSHSANLVVRCDGFLERHGDVPPWTSGTCPACVAYHTWTDPIIVEGFSFDTPEIEAIKNAFDRQWELKEEDASARR